MPAMLLVDRHADAEGVQCLPQYRKSGRISRVEVRREAVQKKIRCARRLRGRRSGHRGACYLQHTTAEGHLTGEHSGRQCLQVRLPGKVDIDWLEPDCSLQQQGRSITAPVCDERELGPYQIDTRLLK